MASGFFDGIQFVQARCKARNLKRLNRYEFRCDVFLLAVVSAAVLTAVHAVDFGILQF